MRDYFIHDNEIIPYENPKADLSFHEIQQIYKPSKTVIKECLKELKRKRSSYHELQSTFQNNLLSKVRNADVAFASSLAFIPWRRDYEKIEGLIDLNEFLLRKTSADEVTKIPITNFIQFKGGWARCPFHQDHKPSFKYYPRENRAHCFSGCGQKNVIQVYAMLNNLSNRDAYFALKDML